MSPTEKAFVPQSNTPSIQHSAAPPAIPDHVMIRRIGSGSYGEVWLAKNTLGEHRAVKVVYRNSFEDDRPFQREFEGTQKFEPISRSHPSQLAILHVGRNETEGYFYYVMELADGEEMQNEECKMKNEAAAKSTASDRQQSFLNHRPKTLRSLLRRNSQPSTLNLKPTKVRLPPAECVSIGLALAEALTHLHKHGLVHRDIKPSNIIFVGGVPKLADIGLVPTVDATRSFVGTEGYTCRPKARAHRRQTSTAWARYSTNYAPAKTARIIRPYRLTCANAPRTSNVNCWNSTPCS